MRSVETASTVERRSELTYADDPRRVVRVRVEEPADRGRGELALPCVIVLHGFKGFMDWGFFPEVSRRLALAGFVAVSFNASGSGIGEHPTELTDEAGFARHTFTRELEDIERVADLARGLEGVDPERMGLLGHSRGGGMALVHAVEAASYGAVVTWSAIDSVDRFDESIKERWRRQGYLLVHNARTGQDHRLDLEVLLDAERNRDRLDVLAACRRSSTPTLVVHGTADESVEPAAAERIAAALPPGVGRLLAIPEAGHTFGARHPMREVPAALERALRASVAHFREHLGQGQGS